MGPIIAQIVRVVAMQVIKNATKQAVKQTSKQVTKQVAKKITKQTCKQTAKAVKNTNSIGGKTVNRMSVGEKYEVESGRHFNSLDEILKNNMKIEHSTKQQVANYSRFNLSGNMPKPQIFKSPKL